MAKKPTIRRVTAPVQERINRLSGILYNFLPLNSRNKNAVTFRSIFAESGIERYIGKSDNKRQALERGWAELYRRHSKLPFKIIRKIVPAAIGYRKYQRKPLTRSEVEDLSACLAELGIDMQAELSDIELDEALPMITVPPEKLKEHLRRHDLDRALSTEPLALFEAGHFNEAVRKAAERLENRIRDASKIEAYGRDLMAKAFTDASLIDLQTLQPENRESFQEGFKFLTMGSMAAIRNVFSHGDEERRSPEECFEMLLFINWLFRVVIEQEPSV